MKNLLAIFIFLCLLPFGVMGQQNHVPNGSFEDTIGCPTSNGDITKCTYWAFGSYGTPEYFHQCSNTWGVPQNARGYQNSASGNAYAGIFVYSQGYQNTSELLQTHISPLQPGLKYEVSLSVSRAGNFAIATNSLGVFFYDTGYIPSINLRPGIINPQILYASYGVITDSQNWTRLTKVFIADSAYDNIVIGGVLPDSLISVDSLPGAISYGYIHSFYYIDSIVVKAYDTFYIVKVDTQVCITDSIHVQYETHYINNSITVQLSDKIGSFTNPINIGTKQIDQTGIITCVLPNTLPNGTDYKVRLITTNPADTTYNISQSITITNPDSSAVNIIVNAPLCKDNTLQFHASTNITPTTYLWSGPNGFNSTSASPYINGASSVHDGNYYVTTKFNGCEVKDTLAVTIKPLPAKPTANNNGPICAGATLNLTASTSTSSVSWSWAGPGSYTSTSQNPNISNSTTAMSGDYIVTADLNGCNRKDTTTVLVKPVPAAVTLSNNTPLCAGDTLKIFSTASTTGVSYTWNGPGSFASGAKDTVIANTTASATGWYKMTVDLNGCTYKDSTNVTVYPIPATPVASYSNPLCVGETLQLNASNITGASYSWTGASSFSSTQQNPTRTGMQFGDTGTYSVTATANGCTSPGGNISVKINPIPFVVILSNPMDSICNGAPVLFTALPNNHGGTPAYQWYVNMQPATTGVVFSTSTLNNGDIISCDMTENTKCSVPYKDESNDIQMTVLPWLAPAVSISANPATPLKENEYVTFTATPTNAGIFPKYQWKRNGQNIVGATGAVWSANTLNDNDEICVEITSSYKCPQPMTGMSNCIIVKVLTGIGDIHAENRIVVYPNPNNGKFVIEAPLYISPKGRGHVDLEIINTFGQIVYHDKITPANGTLRKEIDLGHVAAGVYMLRVHTDEGVSIVRFSVSN